MPAWPETFIQKFQFTLKYTLVCAINFFFLGKGGGG